MALLEARGMVRTYGSVVALDGADFDIEAGQVTALIGDNGAGKSTMVKILSGTEQFEEGEVTLEGQRVVFNNPAAARSHGIETVFQDLALCPHLDPVENLYLNREIKRSGVLGLLGFMDRKAMRDRSVEVFTDLGATVRKLNEPVGTMSGGQKQRIGIARALYHNPQILVFDEATSSLDTEIEKNFVEAVSALKGSKTIIIVAHRLTTIAHCDFVYKMENGSLSFNK